MLFQSFDFLLFFVPVLSAYWLLRDRPGARLLLLLASSYWFYMATPRPPGGALPTPWYFAGLLVFSTVLDYLCAGAIHRLSPLLESPHVEEAGRARRGRNFFLVLSLAGNLGLLGYFKYVDFFLEAFADLARVAGLELIVPQLDLLLPIGISFYTFQSLSYTIDVWRQRLTPEPSFLRFATFVVFFPQLVAGPIVRASEFLPQLHLRPWVDREGVSAALFRILKGLLKVVVLGHFIAAFFTDIVFDAPQDYTSLENLVALYGFTLQMYADFAGYSDIAIGAAALLGFEIPENFDRPHQAKTVGEFWRRWHMTLSTWLRDYLFFPLGGSRGSNLRTYFNLWLTMFLVGMWHGASWNFVVYSNLQAAAMIFNRWNRLRSRERGIVAESMAVGIGALGSGALLWLVGRSLLSLAGPEALTLALISGGLFVIIAWLPDSGRPLNAALHVLLTFHFTTLSRVFFRAADLDSAGVMLSKLLAWDGLGVREGLFRIQNLQAWVDDSLAQSPFHAPLHWLSEYGLVLLLVFGLGYHFTPKRWVDVYLARVFGRLPGPAIGLAFALAGVVMLTLLDGPRANIYFQF